VEFIDGKTILIKVPTEEPKCCKIVLSDEIHGKFFPHICGLTEKAIAV
jgi:hypothetical protein